MGFCGTVLIIASLLTFTPVPAVWSQSPDSANATAGINSTTAESLTAESLVGLTLGELYARFGVPSAVYAVRGAEEWQDDVVMTYGQGDFYIYRDRVWQISLKTGYGLKLGDSRPAAVLALGEKARDQGDHFLLSLPGGGWPLELRVNINGSGRVSAIYVYRPDF
jgi:hypothetical protein